jgi:hypothetical protein
MSEQALEAVMGQALVERGLMTADQVAAELPAQAQQDSDTEGAAEGSHPALQPPPTPDGYRFDPAPLGVEVTPQEMLSVKQALHAEGIPNAIAAATWQQVMKATAQPPTAEQIKAAASATHAKLYAKYGAEAPKVIAAAQAEFDRLDARDPHIGRVILASGVGASLWFNETLYNLARNAGRA